MRMISSAFACSVPKNDGRGGSRGIASMNGFSRSRFLWRIAALASIVLAVQTLAAIVYIIFVVFPAMGRNYNAAVISAGFTGISLGATPTAIANMTAVTKIHGAATIAFIILPLVSAFFIDLANAAVLGFLVR